MRDPRPRPRPALTPPLHSTLLHPLALALALALAQTPFVNHNKRLMFYRIQNSDPNFPEDMDSVTQNFLKQVCVCIYIYIYMVDISPTISHVHICTHMATVLTSNPSSINQ